MAKIIAWLILIFVVLFALRLVGLRNARLRRKAQGGAAPASPPMVRCMRCGVFLPREDARAVGNGYACATGSCATEV